MMFRMFSAALAAGALAAVLITGLQAIITMPIILEAETYENAAPSHDHGEVQPAPVASHDHEEGQGEHDHDAPAAVSPEEEASHHDGEWMPEDGLERMLYTLLANAGAGIGFSLLIVVGLSFHPAQVSGQRGVMWGVAGFAVFTLSPALGLPPGAPGMLTPDERTAQTWWFVTVLCSAGGLACLVFGKNMALKALGPVLFALPHFWGAPMLLGGESRLPPDLAARFAASSIVLSAVFWAVMGYFSGAYYARFGDK